MDTFKPQRCSGSWDLKFDEKAGINIEYINETDYNNYTLMFVTGTMMTGHYIMCIGVSEDSQYYLITDQSKQLWLMNYDVMMENHLFYFRTNTGLLVPKTWDNIRSYYRMG